MRSVTIHLTPLAGDKSYSGALAGRRSGHYVLKNPQLETDGTPVDLPGEIWIPKENVHAIQVRAS